MNQQQLMKKFYQNVKAVCKAKGIPTGELEAKAGCSRGYLSHANCKGSEIGLWLAWRIASVLECDLSELLEEDMWRICRIKELEAELKFLKEGDQKKHEAV